MELLPAATASGVCVVPDIEFDACACHSVLFQQGRRNWYTYGDVPYTLNDTLKFKRIVAGESVAFGLKADGSLTVWGELSSVQRGHGLASNCDGC